MRDSPRSLFLSAANKAAAWWMSAAMAVARRQQRAVMNEMLKGAMSRER
jgi:hypothetical protein